MERIHTKQTGSVMERIHPKETGSVMERIHPKQTGSVMERIHPKQTGSVMELIHPKETGVAAQRRDLVGSQTRGVSFLARASRTRRVSRRGSRWWTTCREPRHVSLRYVTRRHRTTLVTVVVP